LVAGDGGTFSGDSRGEGGGRGDVHVYSFLGYKTTLVGELAILR
jgi:hypothetical protein